MASRCHFRYIVKDTLGNVIQNAAVYLYQPGTTNPVTGTMYNAKTGGATITNPLLSNAQGEVEAYLTAQQAVDVKVTDNTNTAYYPASATSLLDFPDVTELDEVRPDPTDLPLGVGLVGDISTVEVADAAAAGTTGRFADAGHIHAVTAPAAPTTITRLPKPTATAGSAVTAARSDHIHGNDTTDWVANVTADAAAGPSSITEVAVITLTVGANEVAVGTMFEIFAQGLIGKQAAANVFHWKLRWGGVAGTTLVDVSVTGSTASFTNATWDFQGLATIRAIGASGSVQAGAEVSQNITEPSSADEQVGKNVQTGPTTIDTTTSNDFVLTLKCDTSSASNHVTLKNGYIRVVQN